MAATTEVVRVAELMKRRTSVKSAGKIEAEIVAGAEFRGDMADEVEGLGVEYGEALSRKAVFRAVKVKNIPTPIALIVKQEMLTMGSSHFKAGNMGSVVHVSKEAKSMIFDQVLCT